MSHDVMTVLERENQELRSALAKARAAADAADRRAEAAEDSARRAWALQEWRSQNKRSESLRSGAAAYIAVTRPGEHE